MAACRENGAAQQRWDRAPRWPLWLPGHAEALERAGAGVRGGVGRAGRVPACRKRRGWGWGEPPPSYLGPRAGGTGSHLATRGERPWGRAGGGRGGSGRGASLIGLSVPPGTRRFYKAATVAGRSQATLLTPRSAPLAQHARPPAPTMATLQQLVGRWRLVESKGFDEYMKEVGEAPGRAAPVTWRACVCS